MLTLLIDNYDSFTFNLFQLLAEVNRVEPLVVRNDGHSWEELSGWPVDNIVISPGPGHPGRPRDFGVCAAAIRHAPVPVLGVCLGHQAIAHLAGGTVAPAPRPMHGRVSRIRHDANGLFAGLPQDFEAVRYHSLAVSDLPPGVVACAWAQDGVVMALRERGRPLYGVQFHPESIGSEHGPALLQNFHALTLAAAGGRLRSARRRAPRAASILPRRAAATEEASAGHMVLSRRIETPPDPERVFLGLYADSPAAFWLDGGVGGARFSYMGDAAGPLAQVIAYEVDGGSLEVRSAAGTSTERADLLDHLRGELARLRCVEAALPFGFAGGLVGYLGYELKAEFGATGTAGRRPELGARPSSWPDAQLILADRLLAWDHAQDALYLVALAPRGEPAEAEAWLERTATRLAGLGPVPPLPGDAPASDVAFEARLRRPAYLAAVATAQELIAAGESYEVCLTTELSTPCAPDPLTLHRVLRRTNPAPYSAFLRFGARAVVSSSPERYLAIDREGAVETRPIKGTAPRGEDEASDRALREELLASAKDRAENLMIVDVLRNDLGAVCEPGSVAVPRLMELETYPTVHQLVSTVSGRLRAGLDALDAIRASFPGGSMTGAPRLRSMEILDGLERGPRGVYSGAIGWIGLDGGADLSIAIRCVTVGPEGARIGAGGAITSDSDPEREHAEMLLKARAPMAAVGLAVAAGASASAGGRVAGAATVPDTPTSPARHDMLSDAPAAISDRRS